MPAIIAGMVVSVPPPNPAAYQLAVAAALAADGDQDAARRLLALTPAEVMATLAGDAAETFADYSGPHRGPRGGTYWLPDGQPDIEANRVYQDTDPDTDAGGATATDPDTPIRDTLGNAGRVVLGATAGAGVGSFLGGPPGAIIGMVAGAAAGSDIVAGLVDDAKQFFARKGYADPDELAAGVNAGDPAATGALRENTQRQMRHAAGELEKLPPQPEAVAAAWEEASGKMRAADAKALGQRVAELVAAGREPDKVDTAVGNMVGFLGKLTGGAARLAFGAIKSFASIIGRMASGPFGIWAGSLVVGAAVMAAPVAAMVTGLISPATMLVTMGVVGLPASFVVGRAGGLVLKRAARRESDAGTATFADAPGPPGPPPRPGLTWKEETDRWIRPSEGVLGKGSAPGEPGPTDPPAEAPAVEYPPGFKRPTDARNVPNPFAPNATRPRLTPDQAAAFRAYTDISIYSPLNEALREGREPPKRVLWRAVGKTDPAAAHEELRAAFAAAPVAARPFRLSRGITVGDPTAFAVWAEGQRGNVIALPGYQSTIAADPAAGDHFGRKGKYSGNVYFHVHAVHALDARPYSMFPGEDEVLLDHNAEYRVGRVERKDGAVHVELFQLPPRRG